MSHHPTPYDTGQRAEPHIWPIGAYQDDHPDGQSGALDSYGRVDFEDDEANLVATIWLERSEHSGQYIVHIQKVRPLGLRIHQED